MIPALIIEDNFQDQEYLKLLMKSFPIVNILDTANTVAQACDKIIQYKPSLLFLDVELGCQSGFDVLHAIKEYNLQPSVIFTTGYDKYAVEAIRHSAFDYLLKPIDPAELEKAINRLEALNYENWQQKVDALLSQLSNNKKIIFSNRQGSVFIDPEEIFWCEAEGNYTNFILAGNQTEYISCQIGNVSERLPNGDFVRLGRSYIINRKTLSRINRVKKQVLFEKNGFSGVLELSVRQIRELGAVLE